MPFFTSQSQTHDLWHLWLQEQGVDRGVLFEETIPTLKEPKLLPSKAKPVLFHDMPLNHRSKEENLSALYQEILAFQACPLSKTAQHTVFSDGDPNSQLMLIGEAPGAEEDAMGKPFVGMSGQLLTKMLNAIGLARNQVYITNILPWRPPFNRQPTTQEIALCLPFVERHIAMIAPKILVCVGAVASKALLRTGSSMSALHLPSVSITYHSSYGLGPIAAFALYHPAYLLRSPGQKRIAWAQLLRIRNKMQKD